jgi:hypothetical protein
MVLVFGGRSSGEYHLCEESKDGVSHLKDYKDNHDDCDQESLSPGVVWCGNHRQLTITFGLCVQGTGEMLASYEDAGFLATYKVLMTGVSRAVDTMTSREDIRKRCRDIVIKLSTNDPRLTGKPFDVVQIGEG